MTRISTRIAAVLVGVILAVGLTACTRHRVEIAPVKVEPIHITIDVNVKIDRALDDFFSDIDEKAERLDPPAKK